MTLGSHAHCNDVKGAEQDLGSPLRALPNGSHRTCAESELLRSYAQEETYVPWPILYEKRSVKTRAHLAGCVACVVNMFVEPLFEGKMPIDRGRYVLPVPQASNLSAVYEAHFQGRL